jgi:hypothetical protein
LALPRDCDVLLITGSRIWWERRGLFWFPDMSFALLRTIVFTDPLIVVATVVIGIISYCLIPLDKDGTSRSPAPSCRGWMLTKIMGMDMVVEGLEEPGPEGALHLRGEPVAVTRIPRRCSTLCPITSGSWPRSELLRFPSWGTRVPDGGACFGIAR